MEIIYDIEQGSEQWLELRKGVITGTKLKNIVSGPKTQLTEMYQLIADKYIKEESMPAWQILERGNLLEPVAKELYQEIKQCVVEEVGFIKKDEQVGLSPDGIISIDGIYKKAIEIKCPMGKNYIKYMLENKIPDDYKWQVVNYFVVMEDLEDLDFIIYNPDVIDDKIPKIHIMNVTRSYLQKDIDKALDKISEFKVQWEQAEDSILL